MAQCNEPIRVVKELRPVKMTEPKPGVYVFDMGQNMVGWCRLKANAPAGTKITVRHAEMLNDDGTIYTANLRGAAQINEYTWRGGEADARAALHLPRLPLRRGDGLAQPARRTTPSSAACSIPPRRTRAQFACSNELINKIMHCVEWVQRGNMHSVPTDCPQRAERMGWMGDIQAFSQTAIFNMDMAGFFTKWVPDIRDSQADDGRYPDVAPHVADPNQRLLGRAGLGRRRHGRSLADVSELCRHADARTALRVGPAMGRFHPPQQSRTCCGRRTAATTTTIGSTATRSCWKDYPRGISAMPNEVFATAFFAHSTEIVAKMAGVLGRTEDAAKYGKLFEDIKAAFNKAYVDADGRIKGDTQAGYALALHFNLLDESLRPKATRASARSHQEVQGPSLDRHSDRRTA